MHVFYYPDLINGPPVLPETEARHGIKVLRLRRGNLIGITDGHGTFVKAEIVDDEVQNCVFRIIEQHTDARPVGPILHIAVSPLQQQERFEWFVEKATELGVNIITPLLCERTVRPGVRTDRMQKIIISAMKQSARAWLPMLNEPVPFSEFVSRNLPMQRFIAHCMEERKEDLFTSLEAGKDTVILIGPEGDFTLSEVQYAMEHLFLPVSMGSARLRTETAGIAACCMFQFVQTPATKSAI
ncbi:MAG: 16S rRNA (uracil(1498)-N(3))-methyltransferase [Bacteroidales bacterium]|nr:16S rRNA (uracil(1498)-N(3))-methyltransferase [Bacteroidales bacterium]